jgi:hypothetical protein
MAPLGVCPLFGYSLSLPGVNSLDVTISPGRVRRGGQLSFVVDSSTTTRAPYVGPAPVRQGRSGRSRSPLPPPGAIPELDIRLLSQVITVVSQVEHGADTPQNNLLFRMGNVIRVMRPSPRGEQRARAERWSAARRQHEPRPRLNPGGTGPTDHDPGSRYRYVSCTTGRRLVEPAPGHPIGLPNRGAQTFPTIEPFSPAARGDICSRVPAREGSSRSDGGAAGLPLVAGERTSGARAGACRREVVAPARSRQAWLRPR